MSSVEPSKVPRIYFMIKALEAAPQSMAIMRDGQVSFLSLVKWLRRRRPDIYEALAKAYGCWDPSCISVRMSMTLRSLLDQLISLNGGYGRVGDIRDGLRELAPRLYPSLRL